MSAGTATSQHRALPVAARADMAILAAAWSYTPFAGNETKHVSPRRCSRSMP